MIVAGRPVVGVPPASLFYSIALQNLGHQKKVESQALWVIPLFSYHG
jgi:hypothetical protein